ncbi:MAG: response regulator transcription factor [Alphaproteobacteria bacterium]|nr:response regulator transcription factor [Alphaproteobacteria bacterium]
MKFLIADDHELFLQGLEFILKKEYPNAQIKLANSYSGIMDILKTDTDFDLIITDLAMPGGNWLSSLQKMHEICSETPIIIISAVFDKEVLQKTYDIGVSGYISKSFSNAIIISAINLVLAGGMYIPPDLLKMSESMPQQSVKNLLKKMEKEETENEEETVTLTPRQTEVLNCIAEGLSNKQIAGKLGLSEGTVKIHITLLMRSLNVTNRIAAIRAGEKLGLISYNTTKSENNHA